MCTRQQLHACREYIHSVDSACHRPPVWTALCMNVFGITLYPPPIAIDFESACMYMYNTRAYIKLQLVLLEKLKHMAGK